MARRMNLAEWHGFKAPPEPGRRQRKARPEPTEAELHERNLDRAWRCGARYSLRRWKRRLPPRLRGYPLTGPRAHLDIECARAFYRGYDAGTRAQYANPRPWEASFWPACNLPRAARDAPLG